MSDEDTKFWIYAGGLPYELTEGDIVCVFSQYGEILEISLSRDKETGKSRGFCFLKYEDPRSCELAVDNLNGAVIVGRKIKVSFANNINALKAKKPSVVAPTEMKMLPAIEPNEKELEHKHSDEKYDASPSCKRHKRSKHSHEESSRKKRHNKSRHRDTPSPRRHESSKHSHKDSKRRHHKSKHHSHTRSPSRREKSSKYKERKYRSKH